MTGERAATRTAMMRAAAAAGGAAAALMSFAVTCDDDELAAAADECLEPVLCAALRVIEAAGIFDGEDGRAALRDLISDYIEAPAAAQPELTQ